MSFNLIRDPWIPIRFLDGSIGKVSLHDAFDRSEEIKDLDVLPHERVSLVRLLVCVAQSATGIPDDDWATFRSELKPKTSAYLARPGVSCYFDLYGEGPRFLQLPCTPDDSVVPASKLFVHLATGNNPTILDHGGGQKRVFEDAELALALLVFQNFYPLYGAGYKGRGPCVDRNMLHTIVRGTNLSDSVVNNCIDEHEVNKLSGGAGRPLWEEFPESAADTNAVANATTSYLGRLVPMHRTLWLATDRTEFQLSRESIVYPAFDEYSREPSATVQVFTKKKQQDAGLLSAKRDRGVWRQLHALTILTRDSTSVASAPPVLQCFSEKFDETTVDENYCRVWTGALITDLKAKVIDLLESSFDIPEAMFGPGKQLYQSGVVHAEETEGRLLRAVRRYCSLLMDDSARTVFAARRFWDKLDLQSDILLGIVKDSQHPGAEPVDFSWNGLDEWSKLVRTAQRSAFRGTCPRQTPRQILAYASAAKSLYPREPKK